MHKLISKKNITEEEQKQKINDRELNRVIFPSPGTNSKINISIKPESKKELYLHMVLKSKSKS